jgi:drug/metabolite transporter (DMT)-like permease
MNWQMVKFMVLSVFFFSLMNLGVKFIPHLPPTEIVFFRSLVSMILSVQYLLRMRINPFKGDLRFLFLRGLAGVAALTLFFMTLQKLPLAGAATIQYLSPIFTAVFSFLWLKEKVSVLRWLMFGLSFAGVLVMQGFDHRIPLDYALLGIVSAMFAGLAYYSIGVLKNKVEPIVVVTWFPMVALPIMGLVSIFVWVTPKGTDWLYLIAIGICTQLGQLFMTKAFMAESASAASGLKYLGLIFSFLWGFIFFEETYNLFSLLGMLMIITGVVVNVRAGKTIKPSKNE